METPTLNFKEVKTHFKNLFNPKDFFQTLNRLGDGTAQILSYQILGFSRRALVTKTDV